MSSDQPINVVWLKRDLRLEDHEPLYLASQHNLPVLLVYLFEPMLLDDHHYDQRHWRFVWQSLMDLRTQLKAVNGDLVIMVEDALTALQQIHNKHPINQLFSHQEVGLKITHDRDLAVKAWCDTHQITWHECAQGAVIRGLKNRKHWDRHWNQYMRADINTIDWSSTELIHMPDRIDDEWLAAWQNQDPQFQPGGPTAAKQCLESFFEARGQNYHRMISKPAESRINCSRMSPYLAWGNISLRSMYQQLLNHWQRPYWRRALSALSSRLHWHCHFIQKFESESSMEFSALNSGFELVPYRKDAQAAEDLERWKSGNTGYPLVDACMRCLHQTGYINFRMRAMLVSFLCHNLQIDWRLGVKHLARLFLDFEPGIHYPQFQVQAGLMGIHTLRI